MKKLLSLCISLILLFGIVPLGVDYPAIAFGSSEKKTATFIAVTFKKVGYDRDGKKLEPERYFPWEYKKGSSWGRAEVGMDTPPLYWAEFYLTIDAKGGESKPKDRWVVVMDEDGKLWFDPDGNFHNSNYDVFSDPDNPAFIPGRCEGNPRALVDPLSNTQGPYTLNSLDFNFKPDAYFYDRFITGKGWRIGWADLVDYPANGSILPDGTISIGEVKPGDWDLNLKLEKFINDDDKIADEAEEWHAENIAENDTYDYGEFIYKIGNRSEPDDDPKRSTVHSGDIRLTNVSIKDGEQVKTYYSNTIVEAGDKDVGSKIVPFLDDGSVDIQLGEEWHLATQANSNYDTTEAIYLKLNGIPELRVQVGDLRLTNVNSRFDASGLINDGLYVGDVLILSPVLEANCDGSSYDLSVETDLWMNINPSVTTARLFSPMGEIPDQAQRIQKSTVLDPDGKTFYVPATTFSNIKVDYREYIGVEIFLDNGVDNNIGANLSTDKLYSNNASDDYRSGRTGEEFLGAISGNYAFDYGRILANFPSDTLYYDIGENGFGCGETIYRKATFNATATEYFVEVGDQRLTDMTIELNNQRISYKTGSFVTLGDPDIGFKLSKIPSNIKFFDDEFVGEKSFYDPGEPIYLSNDELTGPGDVRLTEIEFGGKTYNCNSELENPDFWYRESPIHMVSAGLCGDGRCIDITVLPGKLDLDIQLSNNFKVEQTTEISVKLNTKLAKGDKVSIVVKEPQAPSFAGTIPEPPTYQEILLPQDWLPPWPEDAENADTYRLAPFPYNPLLRHDNSPLITIDRMRGEPPYHWSKPSNYFIPTQSLTYMTYNQPAGTYNNQELPTCAPSQGPYRWVFPDNFIFPFFGKDYFQFWAYPFPAVRLTNKTGNHFRNIDNSNSDYNSNRNWGRHAAELIIDPNKWPSDVPELSAMTDYWTAIAPPRFTWNCPGVTYPPGVQASRWVGGGSGGYGGATIGWHNGWYNPNNQPKTNGVWAYVDDSVSPRRLVITWIINWVYDFTNTMNSLECDSDPSVPPYTPYNVQMVLYEDGCFQYNYNGVNRWWTVTSAQYPGPAVGWFYKQGVGRQVGTHHMNRDLTDAPSVLFRPSAIPEPLEIERGFEAYVDYRELDNENTSVKFNYTPYRGTCNEDGTRTRLEILAFLDKGGVRYPVPLDAGERNITFDEWDIPIGVPSGAQNLVYIDRDENKTVSEGDLRLTEVSYKGETYSQGSIVEVGDTDREWINDENAEGWGVFEPYEVPLGGAAYDDGTLIVYADLNKNALADTRDIRLVEFNGYIQGSVVTANDWEVKGRQTPLFPVSAPVGIIGNYVYWDRDWSQTVSKYDIRLTAINAYRGGTKVLAGDADVGTPYRILNFPVGICDPIPEDPYNYAINSHTNVYAHLGDYSIKMVQAGDRRLSDCYLKDPDTGNYYKAYSIGSTVKETDKDNGTYFDYYDPKIFMWSNEWMFGVYADLDDSTDHPPYPYMYYRSPTQGDVRISRNIWKGYPYIYEYYRPKSYDPGTVLFPPYSDYVYPDHAYYEQLDCQAGYWTTVFNSGLFRVNHLSISASGGIYVNIDPPSNTVKPGDFRLTETGMLYQGSVVQIDDVDRQSGYLYDPFWALRPWTKLELDENPFKALNPIPEVQPYPLMPSNIYNGYDCYAWFKYDIAAEDLILETDKCIDLYEQRFPNVYIRVKDADNPNDVNDPANIAFSSKGGKEALWMNFNAHGGGIKFLFTAVGEPPSYQKYIGQYLDDDTVVFWYWYDNDPYGFLDPNDFLKSTYDCSKSGYFKPVGSNPTLPYFNNAPPFPARIWDSDCSFGQTVCNICGDEPGYPKLGEVYNRFYNFSMIARDIEGRGIWNTGDQIINTLGNAPSFDGETVDPQIIYCGSRGDGGCTNVCLPKRYGTIWTYGVPVQLTKWTDDDEGGRILIPIKPFKTDTPVTVRLYSTRTMYDKNSKYPHGPAFIHDISPGIDYCGTTKIKVLEPDPKVNFGEFTILDHSLQNTKVNYTSGDSALSPKAYPTPLIHADYDPIIENYKHGVRAYPGGQTHTARIANDESRAGFNSYPALWSDMFNKLGTEMYPFSDYSLYFILTDGMDRKIWWDQNIRVPSRNLKSITIEGPFMRPKVFERIGGAGVVTQSYKSTYPDNLPIQYDYSGKVVIDISNYNLYSTFAPPDLTRIASPFSVDSYQYKTINQRLYESKKLWYYGVFNRPENPVNVSSFMADWEFISTLYPPVNHMVHIIDEIIPISNGKLSITIELYDGTIKKYQECCNEVTEDIPVHGLEINTNTSNISVDTDTKLEVNLKEYDTKTYPPSEHVIPCNDALVLVWQDRGIKDAAGNITGAGDGWITVPPHSSVTTSVSAQLNKQFDINNDGKVSYSQWETEIIGTYDIATNTWSSGVFDARSFNRNDGNYIFDMTADNGALVDTIGLDFGGPTTKNNLPDHVIDDYELLNVNITAFKYGDDDNDRAFTPLYSITKPYEYSHEVYLAGHKALPVVARTDLIVDYEPKPLTAGSVPELLEGGIPLTIRVLDSEGKPVNLKKGVADALMEDKVEDDVIWNVLFKDPHPDNKEFFGADAKLPQYYWVRTDLHNDDGSMVNNYRLYSFPMNPFLPISTDFNEAEEGKYVFKGFCANDEGSLKIYVDTPDRRHRGVVEVKVELPKAEYAIADTLLLANYASNFYPNGIPVNSVGNDTDFVMTASNLSLYYVAAIVKDAQGNLIKGAKTSEQLISGEKKTRFTPYNTKPDNFNYYPLAGLSYYSSPELGSKRVRIYTSTGGRYYNNTLIPSEKNPDISYVINIGGFNIRAKSSWTSEWSTIAGITYYNTTNWQWDDGTWELYPVWDLPPAGEQRGWGRGAIYNNPYKGGYLFPDWGGGVIDGILDYTDSLAIDDSGQIWLPFGANDIGYIGGLIGKNPYSTSVFGDVAGGLWNFRSRSNTPADIRYRFNQYLSDTQGWSNADGTFRLDWDAFTSHDAKIGKPVVTVVNETTGLEVDKNLVDPNNYDLIYGKANHLRIRIAPVSTPNWAIWPQGTLVLSDDVLFPDDLDNESKAEAFIWATTEVTGGGETMTLPNGTADALLNITPTGTFKDIAQLKYYGFRADWGLGRYLRDPIGKVWHLADFDVIRALKIVAKTGKELYAGEADTLIVYVYEVGTEKPVSDATVKITGPGIKLEGETDKDGLVKFDILPKEKGIIEINVVHRDLGDGYTELPVKDAKELGEILIDIEPIPQITKQSVIKITGLTVPGNKVTVNEKLVSVNEDGKFEVDLELVEGTNVITITVEDNLGRKAKKILTIVKDTTGPNIFINEIEKLVDVREYTLKGKIEEGATLEVNGKSAKIVGEEWEITIPLDYGENKILLIGKDSLGNETKKEIILTVYHKIEVKLAIGSKEVMVNGVPLSDPLPITPYIKNGTTFVPLRVISEALGAKVEWLSDVKGIVIEFMGKKIEMQIGSKKAIIDGKAVELNTPPEITNGVTFVPIRFVADALGAEVNWIQETKEIIITMLVY